MYLFVPVGLIDLFMLASMSFLLSSPRLIYLLAEDLFLDRCQMFFLDNKKKKETRKHKKIQINYT